MEWETDEEYVANIKKGIEIINESIENLIRLTEKAKLNAIFTYLQINFADEKTSITVEGGLTLTGKIIKRYS